MSAKIVMSGALVALGLSGLLLTAGAALSAPAPLATPLTILELMRANVEIPADGIWALEGNDKPTAQDWLVAEQDAINIIASAHFIAAGGMGKKDREWVVNADWQNWTKDVQTTGIQIRAAVKAKDQKKLADAADHLTDVCQMCHDKYRPEMPSDGVARFPFYPARVLKK